jgi:hypothetical protein
MTRRGTVLAMLTFAALSSSCFAHHARVTKRLEGQYAIGAPVSQGWKSVSPGGADHAWWNADWGSTIYSDSNCGSHYEDGPLSSMADHILYGIEGRVVEEERPLQLDGREALLRSVDGAMDGVKVRVTVVVMKKNACNFDFVFIAKPEHFSDGLSDYMSVVDGFRTYGS